MSVVDREWSGFSPGQVSLQSLLALAYLVVFGSIIAVNCYSYLLAHVPAQKVSTYALVNPVIALGLGALVLHEKVTGGGAATVARSGSCASAPCPGTPPADIKRPFRLA